MLRFEVINSKDIDKYVYDKRSMIIDIREKEDFNRGHIEDAVNIPMDLLVKNYNKMPRDMVLVLYCESGGTSLLAAKELYDRGHIVRALVGGFSNYNGKYRVME
jgi:rhodanese-related sulfurtransferase